MNALLTGLIGVAGTLLGSFTTYFFQSRTAKHDREFRRDERLQQEQLNACSAFAGALAELKQKLVTLWFQRRRSQPIASSGRRPGADGTDTRAARIECDRAGASAATARFRMQLVSGDPDLMTLADAAFDAIGPIRSAAFGEEEPITDLDELREHETSLEASVQEFIKAASAQFRPAGSS